MSRLSFNLGASACRNPQGLSRPVTVLLYLPPHLPFSSYWCEHPAPPISTLNVLTKISNNGRPFDPIPDTYSACSQKLSVSPLYHHTVQYTQDSISAAYTLLPSLTTSTLLTAYCISCPYIPKILGSCYDSGGWSSASQRGGPRSVPGQPTRESWWRKLYCDNFLSGYFCTPGP